MVISGFEIIWVSIGDVIDDAKFTHLANAQGRAVVKEIAFPWLPGSRITSVPATTYSSPEVAEAGMSLEAVQRLDERQVGEITVQLSQIDRGKVESISDGHVKVWHHRLTGKIYRAEVVAEYAGELIAYWCQAIQQKTGLWKLYSVVLPYPTLSLAHKKVADEYVGKTLPNLLPIVREVLPLMVADFLKRRLKLLLAAVFWMFLIFAVRWYMQAQNVGFLQLADQLALYLSSSAWGVIIYLLVYASRFLILFPASILTIMAGYLWGLELGFVYALIAGTISAVPPFLVASYIYRSGESEGIGRFTKYGAALKRNPFEGTLLMRLVYLPYDVVNFSAGIFGVKLGPFLLATFLGNITGTLSFVGFGSALEGRLVGGDISIDPTMLMFSLVMLVVGIGISRVVKQL